MAPPSNNGKSDQQIRMEQARLQNPLFHSGEEIAAVKELLGKNKEQPDLILNLQQANHDLVKENIDLKATNTTFENRALIAERKIIDSADEVKKLRESISKLRLEVFNQGKKLKNLEGKSKPSKQHKSKDLVPFAEVSPRMQNYRIKDVENLIKQLNVDENLDPLFAEKLAKRLFGAEFTAMSVDAATDFVLENHIGYREYERYRKCFSDLGYKILPSTCKMNAFKKSIDNGIVKKEIRINSIGNELKMAYITNIVEVLKQRINKLYGSDGLDLSTGCVDICIVGDKGADTTKLGLLIKKKKVWNSVNNMLLIAMYYGDDNYDNLFTCFKSIARELEAFKLVTINGTSYGVKLHLNGDYKFICSAVGHTGAASAHPCIKCVVKTMENRKSRPWISFSEFECQHRNCCGEDPMNLNFSFSKLPIFEIDEENIHLPFLHILMGVFQALFRAFNIYLAHIDKYGLTKPETIYDDDFNVLLDHPAFNIEDIMYSVDSADYQEHDDLATVPDSPETFATFIELFNHNLKKIGAKATKYWMTFSGNNVSKILEHLDKLFDGVVKTTKMKGYYNAFAALRDIKRFARSEILNEDEKIQAIKCINQFYAVMMDPLMQFNMMPKSHLLISHMPEIIDKYGLTKPETIYDDDFNVLLDHPAFNIEDIMYSVDSADYQEHDDLATVPDSPETFAIFIELFNHNLKKIGAKATKYWMTFSGNNVSKILEHLDKLFDGVVKTTKMKGYYNAFAALRDIKRFARSEILNEDEKIQAIKCINQFYAVMMDPLMQFNMMPKSHLLISHMPEIIGKYSCMNYFSEQPIESMHASINKDMFRVSAFNKLDKLANFITWHNQRVAFNDSKIRE
uniref:Integrase catalytic domain-containing protein n=1 Tax=Rhabditophanes sp. KR3021 TaxID=114890 RepID=A0AC35TUG2_9BILA